MGLKFQNPSFNNLCKIALWIKQKWLSEELIIWSGLPRWKDCLYDGTALKNDKFHLQENFWSDGTESACIHHLQSAFNISLHSPLLAQFHKIPIEVGQPVLGLDIFRNFTEEKINMAPVNMSKSGPIICVNSLVSWDSMIFYFCIFSFFENSIMKP